jgi:hypothetical protein
MGHSASGKAEIGDLQNGAQTHLAVNLQVLQRLVAHLVIQGDAGGLDGDAAVLLILPCVRQAGITSLGTGR